MGVAGSNRQPRRAGASRKPSAAATTRKSTGSARRPPAGNSQPPQQQQGEPHKNGKVPFAFTIPSVTSATRDVHKAIMDAVEHYPYDEQAQFAIRLALEEGLMNAVKHGNKFDASKTVHVEATVTPQYTEITIEDQGRGFDRRRVPDPCAAHNLLKCSGRGLLLMESYMDEVEYTKGGRRVRMLKRR